MKRRLVMCMLVLLLVMSGLALFPGEKVYACSCVESDAQERLETYTTVFTGKVVKKGDSQQSKHDGILREYTFDVDSAWKGVSAKKMKIVGKDGWSDSCGIQFEKNQSYLIFASLDERDNRMHTNLCSGNVPIEQAGDDLELLGAGKVVSKEDFGETNDGGGRSGPFYLILYGGVILLAALAIVWIWRRKNRI
ncbi:hypothetical protein KQ941_19615 [Paenibacillus xylanexedens]|uniref:hypothetical protein n=1 Tax=Paenibacillus xylanexedens TaxID=528191 RepID=UPI001F32B453|nr:hypothetical protein [Paenibacillus xylanexedens]MCF7756647.1 hypothetical protein [Paenibacillus xylanexedens]